MQGGSILRIVIIVGSIFTEQTLIAGKISKAVIVMKVWGISVRHAPDCILVYGSLLNSRKILGMETQPSYTEDFLPLAPLICEGITLTVHCSLCYPNKARWTFVEYENGKSTRRTHVCGQCKKLLER